MNTLGQWEKVTIFILYFIHIHITEIILTIVFFNLESAFTFNVWLYLAVLIDCSIWHRNILGLDNLYSSLVSYISLGFTPKLFPASMSSSNSLCASYQFHWRSHRLLWVGEGWLWIEIASACLLLLSQDQSLATIFQILARLEAKVDEYSIPWNLKDLTVSL